MVPSAQAAPALYCVLGLVRLEAIAVTLCCASFIQVLTWVSSAISRLLLIRCWVTVCFLKEVFQKLCFMEGMTTKESFLFPQRPPNHNDLVTYQIESNERAKDHIYLLISERHPVNRKAIFNCMLQRQGRNVIWILPKKRGLLVDWAEERTQNSRFFFFFLRIIFILREKVSGRRE